MVSPWSWLKPLVACPASYARVEWVKGPRSRDDIVFAWMIQYEWLLFFGLILALAIADLVATRRAELRSREQEASKHNSADQRD
jgi:hypothetical protein